MSLVAVLLLAAIAIGVPLLSVLTLWFLSRGHSDAADAASGMPENAKVGLVSKLTIVGCFAGIAMYLAYRAITDLRWFGAAMSLFFFMQAIYLHLIFRNSADATRYPLRLPPKQWRCLAAGSAASTLLAVIGGIAGEGLVTWVWAFLLAWLTAVLLAASRRTSPVEL